VGRGDVFVVDEDTDLVDQNILSKNGGKPSKSFPTDTTESRDGKPASTSKHLDENITTDKHKPGKPSPKKPVDTRIINLDVQVPEKPTGSTVSSGETLLETTSSPEDRESNLLKEDLGAITQAPDSTTYWEGISKGSGRTVSGTPDIPAGSGWGSEENPGTVILTGRHGDLVRGSDGNMYRIQRGPMGPVGPRGEPVSIYSVYQCCCKLLNIILLTEIN